MDAETYPDEIFYAGLIGGGCPNNSSIFVVKYDQAMTLTAVAYDYDNNPTVVYRDVMMFTPDGASPVKDFIGSDTKASAVSPKISGSEKELVIPVGVKRNEGPEISEEELRLKEIRARSAVEELRREKIIEEFSERKTRRKKLIAK